MIEHDAIKIVGDLVVSTTGWSDPAVDGLIDRMTREWPDPALAVLAVEDVIHSWTKQSRPTWAVLDQAYRSQVRRREMETPRIESRPTRLCGPADGFPIAYRAYCGEVEAQGREPKSFADFRGANPIGEEPKRRPRAKW